MSNLNKLISDIVKSEQIVKSEMRYIKIKLPVLPSDLKTLPTDLTELINQVFDKSAEKIPQYYPPLEQFQPDYDGKKRPAIPTMKDPTVIPKGVFPENSNYKTLWDLKDIILKENMKDLLVQIDAFSGKKTIPIYSPTCVTTTAAKEIVAKSDEVYCSSYQSSVPELKDITPTLNRDSGNVSNVGCIEPKVKLSCNVPSYFNLYNSLDIINSCVRNILGALTLIDDLILYNDLYMKRIDNAMDSQIEIQNWYESEKKTTSEATKSDYSDIFGFGSMVQNFETYYKQIDNYFYSYYSCMYAANTYFKNKCHGSYLTSCTAILTVIDRINVYVQNVQKYIKAIILAKKQIKYSQEAIDYLNKPIDELKSIYKRYKYINGQLSKESPYYIEKKEPKYIYPFGGSFFFILEYDVPTEKHYAAFQETYYDNGFDEANIYSCMYLGKNKVTEPNCDCKRIADVMGSWGIYQKVCYSRNEGAIKTITLFKQNAQTNIDDNLAMYKGTPFVIPPNVTIGCCSLELYCPKGDCDVVQFCKIKISSNAVGGEQIPTSVDKNSAPVMLPGQKEINAKYPLCWSVENAKDPNQCMAGWLLFTDGNCYAPQGVINAGSPYNKQELASFSNDDLYYYFTKFQINQPVTCPAPKLAPKVQNIIKTNQQLLSAKQEIVSKPFVFSYPSSTKKISSDNQTLSVKDITGTFLPDQPGSNQDQGTEPNNISDNTSSSWYQKPITIVPTPKQETVKQETPLSIFTTTNIIIIIIIILLVSSSSMFLLLRNKK